MEGNEPPRAKRGRQPLVTALRNLPAPFMAGFRDLRTLFAAAPAPVSGASDGGASGSVASGSGNWCRGHMDCLMNQQSRWGCDGAVGASLVTYSGCKGSNLQK